MKHLKQEFDKLSFKDVLMFTIASLCMLAGFVLLFLGMWLPPKGEIHYSVLTAFGIILTFVGAILQISFHYGNIIDKIITAKGEEDRRKP